MIIPDASGAVTKLIDVFIKIMSKESILYISILEYISDACLEIGLKLSIVN